MEGGREVEGQHGGREVEGKVMMGFSDTLFEEVISDIQQCFAILPRKLVYILSMQQPSYLPYQL